ncbi:MAG: EAL domain-containing protein [Actinobacteria bacterium]|nr:EAL domain-containing protein [Actinomycetota bacterium]
MKGADDSDRGAVAALRRLAAPQGIWALTAALWAGAVTLFLTVVRDLPARSAPFRIPLIVMVILFYVVEAHAVHLRLGSDAHSFTLSEIPLVIGLFVLNPSDLMLARLIGGLAALAVHDQQPIKLFFNLGYFLFETAIAIVILETLWPHPQGLEPQAWVAAFVTVMVTNLLGSLLLFIVISLSQKRMQLATLPFEIGLGAIVTIGNGSLALLALTILAYKPWAVWLLIVPTGIVFLAYRAYTTEREKRDSLTFLYETTRILNRSARKESALISLLEQARGMFKADMAEIVLFPSSWDGAALRTALGPGDEVEVLRPLNVGPSEELWARAAAVGHARFLKRPARYLGPDHRWSAHIKDALIAPLHGESRVLGTMMVGNRAGIGTFDPDDLNLLGTLANHASVFLENGRLERTLVRLRQMQEQLRHQATHDPLTGLINRAFFNERVSHALELLDRSSGSVAVLLLDLDDFKTVNDTFGHAVGDELLVIAAQCLKDSMRPGDTVARQGGDEFAILIEDVHNIDEAGIVAKRIIDSFKSPFTLQDRQMSVHASLGIAMSAAGSESTAQLLRNADVAMYAAKSAGKDGYQIYAPDMGHSARSRLRLKGNLQHALQHEEMEVVYQPIVDLREGGVTGVEALIRWAHPERGQVMPDEFLLLAEETGLIIPMGRWVLKTALAQAAEWQERHPDALDLSINLSAKELEKPTVGEEIAEVLAQTDVDPSKLTLEITETSLMRDTKVALSALTDLKALDVRIAIDDFGTGYSSLSYLERFPIDVLKIDKSFIDTMGKDPKDTLLAQAVVKIGEALGLTTIAEGIEHLDQLVELRKLNCDMGQGYLFAKPLRPEEVDTLLVEGAGRIGLLEGSRRAEPSSDALPSGRWEGGEG